jgi:hypothetical protein
MNGKINLFLLAVLILNVATIAHSEENTIPAQSLPLFTIPKTASSLEVPQAAVSSPISKDQVDHFALTQKHPESIPHDRETSARQDDITILCLLVNGTTQIVEGSLKLSSSVSSPLYKQICEKAYPSCWPDVNCKWRYI